MPTLRYGEETLATVPNNTSQLITPAAMQDIVVSQRNGGALITNTTQFTLSMSTGVAVSINPLLPDPVASSGLWKFDANNRAFPDYENTMQGLTVPPGYQKFIIVTVDLGVEKQGGGTDGYRFQLDNAGVPVGNSVVHSFTGNPTYFGLTARFVDALDTSILIGITITAEGTNDNVDIDAFSMFIQDFQLWAGPP